MVETGCNVNGCEPDGIQEEVLHVVDFGHRKMFRLSYLIQLYVINAQSSLLTFILFVYHYHGKRVRRIRFSDQLLFEKLTNLSVNVGLIFLGTTIWAKSDRDLASEMQMALLTIDFSDFTGIFNKHTGVLLDDETYFYRKVVVQLHTL